MTHLPRNTIADPAVQKVVALGGGHGLAATLGALRRVAAEITAIVTVGDDGGSSGRIRRELPSVLPPGDLRMALAALAADDEWHQVIATVLQHRFGGQGALAGHSAGNLLLTAVTEVLDNDPVAALDAVGKVVGAVGRVLPMSLVPLEIAARVSGIDPHHPGDTRRIRGQVAVATTPGRVESIELLPDSPPACPEACTAIARADAIVLGPGSWFSSVLPHLLVPDLRRAIESSPARRYVSLNLQPQAGETDNFTPAQLLTTLAAHAPQLRIDGVIADERAVADDVGLEDALDALGAELLVTDLASARSSRSHDPVKYAMALRTALGTSRAAEGVAAGPGERAQ
ncbi:gluconeogenesis factor YvcK family protein [Cumulibacter manganitolerans]|uniref:gluconeogenesis factor YvcK family protein n=1 Tax=Cumulibacter manganitolerans TaxID=1884992 RepID=UPI0012965D5A|nr:uridine diphosphate-N-acetylglucosamine-binding protein YvcK [Cumulibacter manganitolerans]